jgi:carbon-monoxide dehydrogenase large subunit
MTTWAPEAASRFVGRRVERVEDPRMLTGRGRYLDDMDMPGLLHVAFVRSHVAHGRIRDIDVSEAARLPGVHAVLTAADLNHAVKEWWAGLAGPPPVPYPPNRALADVDVRFVGDPIVMVVARDRYIAEDAAELVDVTIETLPALVDAESALSELEVLVHPELGTNVARAADARPDPALDSIFRDASYVIEMTFRQARAAHAPMEPRGIIASWDAPAGEMRILSSSQNPYEVRAFCARLTGVPEHRIHASIGDVGGGFGQKVCVSKEEACIMLASHRLGRPLKWVEDRWENLVAAGHGRDDSMTLGLALDSDGTMLALRGRLIENVGAYPSSGVGSSGGMVAMMLPGPYRIPKQSVSSVAVFTNTPGRVSYRGPWLMESVAREQLVDAAARRIGMDPLELRRRNVIRPEDLPYRTATGQVYDSVSAFEVMEQAAAAVGYDEFRVSQKAARANGRLNGIGLSLYVEPSGIAPPGPLATEGVVLRVEPAGGVTLFTGAANCGNSIETTLAQIVADRLGCDIADVAVVQGDSAATPVGNGMGGSRNAPIFGSATWEAAGRLYDRIVAVAAHHLEASPEDMTTEHGAAFVRGTPSRRVSFAELARVSYQSPALPDGMDLGLEVLYRFGSEAPFTWTTACHVAICEVDPDTGQVDLTRFLVSEDCGTLINPMVVDGQIAGGVVQGVGGVLYEHMVYDADGNPLTASFMDYLLPTSAEVPFIECHHLQTPSRQPGGFRGMGEGGAIGSPPAVANAVADALAGPDPAVVAFPFRPCDVLARLDQAQAGTQE